MADFEVTMKKTSTKLQMLKIARHECYLLLQRKELEMHLKAFEERLEDLSNFKRKVQVLMLDKDDGEWSSKHEAEVQEMDAPIEELQKRIKELKDKENKERKAEEGLIEEGCLQQRYEEEKRLETMKI